VVGAYQRNRRRESQIFGRQRNSGLASRQPETPTKARLFSKNILNFNLGAAADQPMLKCRAGA
jgi:hypothetical protein